MLAHIAKILGKLSTPLGFGIILSNLINTTPVWAQPETIGLPHPQISPGENIVNAINQLRATTIALALASQKTANELANAVDKELANVLQVGDEQDDANNQALNTATEQNQDIIHTNLAQFPNNILTYSNINDPQVQQAIQEKNYQDNLINKLTLDVPASDTLYSAVNNIEAATSTINYSAAKPDVLYDNYFDFNSLVAPDSYNPDQQKAAQYFITYLTKNYQNLTAGVNFSDLQNYLNQLTSDPITLAQKLQALRNNIAYKNFQLNIRSAMATRSLSLSVLNDIMAERVPLRSKDPDPKLEAISQLLGVTPEQQQVDDPDNPGQKVTLWTYVSPLQINNYLANHRINDPKWYQQVSADSAENLLRKLVIMTAENENLAQQNHIDNEKIMALLATLNSSMLQANQLLNKTQVDDVNTAISDITGTTTPEQANTEEEEATQAAAATTENNAATTSTTNPDLDTAGANAETTTPTSTTQSPVVPPTTTETTTNTTGGASTNNPSTTTP